MYSPAMLGVSRQLTRYWALKRFRPNFHSGRWGGFRRSNSVFAPEEIPLLRSTILNLLSSSNNYNLARLTADISIKFNRQVSCKTISRILRSWRWSWKVPSRVQVLKFTLENIITYAAFAVGMQYLDWNKLKFLDESHIVSRGMYSSWCCHNSFCGELVVMLK